MMPLPLTRLLYSYEDGTLTPAMALELRQRLYALGHHVGGEPSLRKAALELLLVMSLDAPDSAIPRSTHPTVRVHLCDAGRAHAYAAAAAALVAPQETCL